MKTLNKIFIVSYGNRVFMNCTLLISFILLLAGNAHAQNGGASLGNLNKNLNAASDQITHDEMIQYLYMGIGFALVIAIAWFSTSLAKKRRIAADEERAKRTHHAKHPSHDPYFKSHGQSHRVRK